MYIRGICFEKATYCASVKSGLSSLTKKYLEGGYFPRANLSQSKLAARMKTRTRDRVYH
jgi:hypothetical protein